MKKKKKILDITANGTRHSVYDIFINRVLGKWPHIPITKYVLYYRGVINNMLHNTFQNEKHRRRVETDNLSSRQN